jgi:pimeloyl-ACP methyl ester carboxylesterase
VHIAYQLVGHGSPDIVYTPGFISNIDRVWAEGGHGELLEKFAGLGRLIVFDRRGTGLSDRPNEAESLALELGLNDLRAVLDAAASTRPVLFGYEDGGTLAAMFAAAHPDRVSALILFSPWVKGRRSPDYPWAWSHEEQLDWERRVEDGWGSEPFVRWLFDSEAPGRPLDHAFVEAFARYLRSCASPGTVLAIEKMQAQIDARPILPTISVPTITLRRQNPTRSLDEVRHITDMIPAAQLVELSGNEQVPFLGNVGELVRTVEMFVDGIRDEEQQFDRSLATVLFTDIVGSTARAAKIGDRAWKVLVERHHAIVRALLTRYRGSVVDTAGDGFFSTFDGPARAVRCAQQIIDALEPTGLEIRAGVHTGEIQTIDGKSAALGW